MNAQKCLYFHLPMVIANSNAVPSPSIKESFNRERKDSSREGGGPSTEVLRELDYFPRTETVDTKHYSFGADYRLQNADRLKLKLYQEDFNNQTFQKIRVLSKKSFSFITDPPPKGT